MGKRLKVYMEWLDSVGYSPYVWLRGDWHQPLHLLSKLLADHLNKRRPLNSVDDIAFKIGFNAMLQLAEEFLGIPCLITERDLMIQYPNIILAMLIYLICVKHSVDFIDPKSLRNIVAPRLIFEARNGCDAHFPKCASCCEHVFIIERVVVDACVWHRNCFKCVECNAVMRSGGFKKSKRGYECITHAVRRILDVTKAIRSPRPKVAPPNVPPVNTIIVEASSIADTSRSFMAPAVSPKLKSSIVKQKPSPPPKPVGLSTFRKDRTTTLTEDVKSSEITSDYEVVSVSSENTGDSGIVMRGQDLLEETSADGYRIVSPTPKNMQSIETELPVPPPRPKRASMLLKFLSESNPAVDSIFSSSALSSNKVSTTPLQLELSTTQIDDEECKNPFADSDDECDTSLMVTASRIHASTSTLPGESDRPKCTPPPPPMSSSPSSDKVDKHPFFIEERFRTLKISKKSFRAPHPAMAMCGKEMLSDNRILEGTSEIAKKLEMLDGDMEKLMREGKQLEVEMLFLITQNPSDWIKMPRTEEFVDIMCRFLNVLQESNALQFRWYEAFLNEIHLETEYSLRRIVTNDTQEGKSVEREKQLLNLLIYVIDEKARISEEIGDRTVDRSTVTKKELKRLKYKLQMALLSKKK